MTEKTQITKSAQLSEFISERRLTYSPAYTIVPTYECFNRCRYCHFRRDPGQSPWLTLDAARSLLATVQNRGICEILILSGEVHPRSPQRSAWVERLYDLGKLAIDMGFLPHTNAGPLQREEMAKLAEVNVSMGLMLEQLTPKLLATVHDRAPSKRPDLRLHQLAQAGELRIPFTTGLLLGIGETESDRRETLEAIAQLHQHWGHVQEVILQPHRPGTRQSETLPSFFLDDLPQVVAIAREILPPDIALQIPPNLLSSEQLLLDCLAAGARDLGGIGPLDEVNPDYDHFPLDQLRDRLAAAGWQLVPRLPVYPHYLSWLSPSLQPAIALHH